MTKTPITALYAAAFTLWFLFLSLQVVMYRRRVRVGLGDGADEEMQKRIRIHGNAAEYLPLGLVLLLLLELNTALVWPLHVAGIALVLGRVLHWFGIHQSSGVSVGRFTGVLMTWITIGLLALADLIYALAILL